MGQFRKAYTAAGAAAVAALGGSLVAGDVSWRSLCAAVGAGLLAGAAVYKVSNG